MNLVLSEEFNKAVREEYDLKRAVNEELKVRNGVVDYEITESSPEHVLVKVIETTEDGDSRGVFIGFSMNRDLME